MKLDNRPKKLLIKGTAGNDDALQTVRTWFDVRPPPYASIELSLTSIPEHGTSRVCELAAVRRNCRCLP